MCTDSYCVTERYPAGCRAALLILESVWAFGQHYTVQYSGFLLHRQQKCVKDNLCSRVGIGGLRMYNVASPSGSCLITVRSWQNKKGSNIGGEIGWITGSRCRASKLRQRETVSSFPVEELQTCVHFCTCSPAEQSSHLHSSVTELLLGTSPRAWSNKSSKTSGFAQCKPGYTADLRTRVWHYWV